MIIHIALLIVGFVLLVKGADYFVTGASALGVKFKIPQVVIGLTIVSLGTSLPELFVNIMGSINDKNDIVLGNIVGSNIFNILLILGVASVIFPITAREKTVWREIPYVILVSVVLFVLSNDTLLGESTSVVSRGDGVILLLFLSFFIYYLYKLAKSGYMEHVEMVHLSSVKITLYLVFGLAALVFGGELVVSSAVAIAKKFAVPDKVIAVTIIAMGTGLPELVTSVVAACKKNSSIAIGNIVGSNIFNILLVVGISAIISPISYTFSVYIVDYTMLIISALVLFLVMNVLQKHIITRIEGIAMIVMYVFYVVYNIMSV